MIVQVVKYKSGLADDEVRRVIAERAPRYETLPRLRQKLYIREPETGEYGGSTSGTTRNRCASSANRIGRDDPGGLPGRGGSRGSRSSSSSRCCALKRASCRRSERTSHPLVTGTPTTVNRICLRGHGGSSRGFDGICEWRNIWGARVDRRRASEAARHPLSPCVVAKSDRWPDMSLATTHGSSSDIACPCVTGGYRWLSSTRSTTGSVVLLGILAIPLLPLAVPGAIAYGVYRIVRSISRRRSGSTSMSISTIRPPETVNPATETGRPAGTTMNRGRR